MELKEINNIVTIDLIQKNIKGRLSPKQIKFLQSCIVAKLITEISTNYNNFIETIYKENIESVSRFNANLIADLLKLNIKEGSKYISLVDRKKQVKAGIIKDLGIIKGFSTSVYTQRIDSFVMYKSNYSGITETRIALLQNAGIRIDNIEDICIVLAEEMCKEFMTHKNFTKIKESDIDFNSLKISCVKQDLNNTTTKTNKNIAVELEKKPIKKDFITPEYFVLTEEEQQIREEYNNHKTTVIKTIEEHAWICENEEKKENFCRNKYGLTNDIILANLYYLDKGMGKEFSRVGGFNAYTPFLENEGLLIPFKSENGIIVGYIQRKINTNDGIKYLPIRHNWNKKTKSHKEFRKGLFLFGLDKIVKKINEGKEIKHIVLVEGELKALLIQQELENANVIATGTCNVSDAQIALLRQYFKSDIEILMGFDNDPAGKKANIYNAFKLLKAGFTNIKFLNKNANFKGSKDENDYVVDRVKEGMTLDAALEDFRTMYWNMIGYPVTLQFPSIAQLNFLTTCNYTLGNIVDLFIGSYVDNEDKRIKDLGIKYINKLNKNRNSTLKMYSVEHIKVLYAKGYCRAIQTEIGMLKLNKSKKEWQITQVEDRFKVKETKEIINKKPIKNEKINRIDLFIKIKNDYNYNREEMKIVNKFLDKNIDKFSDIDTLVKELVKYVNNKKVA